MTYQCQQRGCRDESVTWCPLCEKSLCQRHDELTPRRMHDCMGGPADEDVD
jgi:hypothetical protein